MSWYISYSRPLQNNIVKLRNCTFYGERGQRRRRCPISIYTLSLQLQRMIALTVTDK